MGPEAFLGMPGVSGSGPALGLTFKKGFVPHLPVRWGGQQIPLDQLLFRAEAFSADWHSCPMFNFIEPQWGRPSRF